MIDITEHIYQDDPKIGHPDVRTQLRDVRYYFVGNGLIAAAVQHAPAGEGSLYGLLLMNPQQLKMKREALSFDPDTGIEETMLSICCPGGESPLERAHSNVSWDHRYGFPGIRVEWRVGTLDICELFYCPDHSTARITREIRLQNRSSAASVFSIATGIRSRSIAQNIQLPPGGTKRVCIVYSIDGSSPTVAFDFVDQSPSFSESAQDWKEATQVQFASRSIDHLFQSAAAQLPAVISNRGRVDASIWQYNREWVRDHSLMAHALLLCGHHALARVMLERLLREFISEEGSASDSSELREHADAELDQNGTLLHVLREYVLWTGDLSIVSSNWEHIVRTAEFPLQPFFRDPVSGLLSNQRDYWERHGAYGIEPGIELMYQVYVSIGLSAAAGLARQIGRYPEAVRWQSEAERLKEAILHHPTHSLVWDKGFFKRRGIDGSVQEFIIPQPNSGLPEGVGLAHDIPHPLNPDSACALPIVLGFIPPESVIAQDTLGQLESLWNQGWDIGGYGRYHMDSDPDSPGPWPFASLYIARAYMERRAYDKVWRVLRWLASLPQYSSGAFFEMYGNRIAPPYAQNGIVPWNWAEMIMLVVTNILGFQPEEDGIMIRPRLLPGLNCATGNVRFRDRRIFFAFSQDGRIRRSQFQVNSTHFDAPGGCLKIPFAGVDIHVEGNIPIVV